MNNVNINGNTGSYTIPSTGNAQLGAAVYSAGNLKVVDGNIRNCSASTAANGGAVNSAGTMTFEGNVKIKGNTGTVTLVGQQKNVVLEKDNTGTIVTTNTGLGAGADIGVYPVDSSSVFANRGQYEQDFGTHGTGTNNLDRFSNDRNGLIGEACPVDGHGSLIRWTSYLCKLTDSSGDLLYIRTGTEQTGYEYSPAVFKTLKAAFNATKGLAENGSTEITLCQGGSSHTVYSYSSSGSSNPAINVEMLKNHSMDNDDTITNTAERIVTLTTADTTASDDDVYIYNPGTASGVNSNYATITRGYNGQSMVSQNSSKTLTVSGIILDGNKGTYTCQGTGQNEGGIVKVNTGTLSVGENATLRNSKAANGGAIYVVNGAIVEMTSCTINGNEATTAGAGIYLEDGSTLKLSGNPNFGGTGLTSQGAIDSTAGNIVTTALPSGAKNGGLPYTYARQDIYLAGVAANDDTPLTTLTLTGNFSSTIPAGSIWVWANGGTKDGVNHYLMLKQFAVKADTFTTDVTAETYAAFRNARIDNDTDCGGDYLTGQSGEDLSGKKCIYWTGGFDFKFLKIDGKGDAVPGATFTLYQSQTTKVNGEDVVSPLLESNRLVPCERGEANITGTSANGTTDKDSDGTTVLDKGVVLFQKVAPKTYYMVESSKPTKDKDDNTVTYADNKMLYKVVVVSDTEVHIYETEYDATITSGNVTIAARTGATETEAYKKNVGTSSTPEWQYQIVNTSAAEHKVILRKVDGTDYSSLGDAWFRIFSYDLKEVKGTGYANSAAGVGFKSYDSGVYYIGNLPVGKYYLVETVAPTKKNGSATTAYNSGTNNNVGKIFTLEVKADGMTNTVSTTEKIDVSVAADVPTKLKEWATATTS